MANKGYGSESIGGVPIVQPSSKEPLKVEITAADIRNGDNKNPSACAAARSLVRCNPEIKEARVHLSRTYVKVEKPNGKKVWVRYKTPESLRTEIVAFDRGGKFEPGLYYLKPLQPSQLNRVHPPRGKKLKGGGRENEKRVLQRGNKTKPMIARVKQHNVTGVRARGANR